MTIKALIFDFDGLILDTETPEIDVWKGIYGEHGQPYPMDLWSQIIGGWGNTDFDPAVELQRQTGKPLDLGAIRERHRRESDALILKYPVMPGVGEMLASAQRLGLRCAIASSSDRSWVETHLRRLGLSSKFEQIVTGDDVQKGRTKPQADIFLKALEVLQLEPAEALVIEDSPNGIRAAHAAGLRAVGVPNPVTAPLNLDADLLLSSLAEMPLEEILRRVEGPQGQSQGGEAVGRPRETRP
jgi:HAD superfamily hydrolase (TIGR01509 family)